MSPLRHSWPIVLIAILALLAITVGAGHAARQHDAQASAFAMRHYQRCMIAQPDNTGCTLRTIQLASQLGGLEFGDQVAAELR